MKIKAAVFAFALTVILAGMMPADARADAQLHTAGDGTHVQIVTTPEEAASFLAQNWEEGSYYEEAVIDPESGQVSVDEEDSSLKEQFDLTKTEEKELTDGDAKENAKEITSYLEAEETYDVTQTGGEIVVSSPYQLKRVIVTVREDQIRDTYGADSAAYYTAGGYYLFTYPSEEATKDAYEKLQKTYGSDVYLDTVVRAQALQGESIQAKAGSISWGVQAMGLDTLRDQAEASEALKDQEVVVAVLDSGIYTNNDIFDGRISKYSRNFVSSNKSDLKDSYGHGTHVAGIICDATSSHVKVMVIRVLDANGYGSFTDIALGVQYAVKKGATVMNISAAGDGVTKKRPEYKALEPALKTAFEQGVVICAASGNGDPSYHQAQNLDSVSTYPAWSPYTVAVGAADTQGRWQDFSNYGKSLFCVAPGIDIQSAYIYYADDIESQSGTSMASPHIAAAAAMVKLFHPSYKVKSIKKVLRQHSTKGKNGSRTNRLGYGMVRLAKAADTAIKPAPDIKGVTDGDTLRLTLGKKKSFASLSSESGSTIRITSSKTSVANISPEGRLSAKKIGTAAITFHVDGTASYDYATEQIKVLVVPRDTKIKKITAKPGQMKISWKKRKGVSGYQIRYAKKASMKGAKKKKKKGASSQSVTIKNLKSGTYYVQVRTYKKSGKKTYYSKWSGKKKVVIMKAE